MLTQHIQQADLIITTAAIPGRPSPKLISKAQVAGMKAGAVIVDLSAEGGGNCEDTQPGETTQIGQVTIVAPLNVPSLLGEDASELYAKNQYNLLALMMKDNIITIDWDDEVLAKTVLTHAGEDARAKRSQTTSRDAAESGLSRAGRSPWTSRSSITGFVALYIFMLAAFAGWVIIGRVPAILHTPLMSGSNFVHGIVVVGGIFALLNASTVLEQVIGFFAVLLGAGNAAGGYAVTDRMLAMFQASGHKAEHAKPRPRQSQSPEEGLRSRHAHDDSATDDRRDRSRGGLSVHVRPQAHVVAGDGAVRDLRRRHRHAGRRPGQLSLRLRRQRGGQASICRSISGLPSIALVVGGGVAWWSGKKVAMTSMPQMVALYNGMGGGAAGAIAAVELFGNKAQGVTQLVVTLDRRADRRRVAVRLADRLGQARRGHQQAVAGARAAGLQCGCHAGDSRRRRLHRLCRRRAARHPLIAMPELICAVLRLRAGLRRSDDAADRRRRYAGRDLDLQRLHRPRGRP